MWENPSRFRTFPVFFGLLKEDINILWTKLCHKPTFYLQGVGKMFGVVIACDPENTTPAEDLRKTPKLYSTSLWPFKHFRPRTQLQYSYLNYLYECYFDILYQVSEWAFVDNVLSEWIVQVVFVCGVWTHRTGFLNTDQLVCYNS